MKRVWIVAGALVVTVASLVLAMLLGSVSFDFRRFSQHEGRLRRVMQQQPTADQLTQGLEEEGTPLVAETTTPEETDRVAAEYGGREAARIRAKASRYAQMRVFKAADMLYFVFFDAEGIMRDFVIVSR